MIARSMNVAVEGMIANGTDEEFLRSDLVRCSTTITALGGVRFRIEFNHETFEYVHFVLQCLLEGIMRPSL